MDLLPRDISVSLFLYRTPCYENFDSLTLLEIWLNWQATTVIQRLRQRMTYVKFMVNALRCTYMCSGHRLNEHLATYSDNLNWTKHPVAQDPRSFIVITKKKNRWNKFFSTERKHPPRRDHFDYYRPRLDSATRRHRSPAGVFNGINKWNYQRAHPSRENRRLGRFDGVHVSCSGWWCRASVYRMRWKSEQGKRKRERERKNDRVERVQFALAEYENSALSDANGARRQKRAAGSGLVTTAAYQRIRLSRINRASVARKLNATANRTIHRLPRLAIQRGR